MKHENQNTEYKRKWKDEYLKWVCGFANAHGGKIYIGIDDDLSVVGLDKPQQALEDIPNKIVSLLGIVAEVNLVAMEGKDVLEIIVEPSNIPISYKGSYYYRSGSTKQELKGLVLHQFLLKKTGLNWEDLPCRGASMTDIDNDAVAYFLKKAVKAQRMQPESIDSSISEVLENLGLLSDGTPSNAAILLFGKNPQRFMATSSFKIGRFGSSDHDLLSQDLIEGNILQMTDRVIRTLSDKYLVRPIHYEGLQRIEPLEIPEDALREIIFNSIVHKNQQGSWNQMSIYNDHIRLWNDGDLPDNYTIDTLLGKHTSKLRNPKIANVFYKSGFIEAWGRGIQKILDGFQEEHLTPPTFRAEQGGFSVIIPRERFVKITMGEKAQSDLKSVQKGKPKTTDNQSRIDSLHQDKSKEKQKSEPKIVDNQNKIGSAPQDEPKGDQKRKPKIIDNQNKIDSLRQEDPKIDPKDLILEMIKKDPTIRRIELGTLIGLHISSIQRYLKTLVEDGKLRHVGPSNGGHWEVIG
ncbi:MAG: putative DNA binding domain-containing protein [Bacteroides sp.]|nr:putative DNA binding domain-containing protein [Ruminococcus flavefaciens]MCM1554522.1 putative DNA binding domain-containing protein [Bacteroides sp.]